jgi:hypothetical protein
MRENLKAPSPAGHRNGHKSLEIHVARHDLEKVMTPHSDASRVCFRAALALVVSAAMTFAAPEIRFPPGVDWSNASPEQIREAVFAAVKENPDEAIEIVQAAMENVQQTGRFPNEGAGDGKQVIDPDDGIITLPEIAEQIAQGAIQANPAMAAMITQAVNNAVASAPITQPGATQTTDGGGTDGGGGTSGGGLPPALPGGFGGGGGGGTSGGTTGGGSIYGS